MTTTDPAGRSRVTNWLAGLLASLAIALVLGSIAAMAWAGMSARDAVESYSITNLAIGAMFPAAGAVLARQRPRNPIGWLFIAAGLAQSVTALAAALLVGGDQQGWSEPTMTALATAFAYGWPWSIGLFLPLALLVFPDGTLPSRPWRWAVGAVVVSGLGFLAAMGTDPTSVRLGNDRIVAHWLVVSDYDGLAVLWAVVGLANAASYLLATAALFVRYRRGDERTRRQLLWVLLGVLGGVASASAYTMLGMGSVLLILGFCLIPITVAIAILRHGLLDIRLVVSRTVLWLTLSAAVIAAFGGLVTVLGGVLAQGRSAAVAALTVALALNAVRSRLQRGVDRLFYGDRRDPFAAVSRVEDRLDGGHDLEAVLQAIRQALRLPFVALRLGGREIAAVGDPVSRLHTHLLRSSGQSPCHLVVGLRAGERRMASTDARMLGLMAVPLSVAVHATELSRDLLESRERLVATREDERRRLQRDLHDGLGPTMTGVAMKADAARNVMREHPEDAERLLTELQSETRAAIDEIRRIAYGLRPPALDDLGLVAALRQQALHLDRRQDGLPLAVVVEAPSTLPPLSAAVETAAYHIAMEALTNTVRHSNARSAVVRLTADDALHVHVTDDGRSNGVWKPGVGLRAMRERVDELGGELQAGARPEGAQILATLPLESAP